MTDSNPPAAGAFQPPANGFRTFLILWITQSISVFGSALTFFAITIWLAQDLYPLPGQKPLLAAAISATGLVWTLANILLAPIAGAWADRHDRKRTMMLMDFLSGCISAILAALMLLHILHLWSLLILAASQAATSAFHYAAFNTSYIMIVPEKRLPRANGMMQTMYALSNILAPALAATLIAVPALVRQGNLSGPVNAFIAGLADGSPLAIGLDAITFFVASATLLFLVIPSPIRSDLTNPTDGKSKSLWEDVKVGAIYIWHRRPMLWLLGTFTMANLVTSFFVLQPLVVKFNLAPDWTSRGFTYETALALLTSIGGIGGLAGGVIISVWGGLKKKRVYGVVIPLLVLGIVQVIYGFSPWLYLTCASIAIIDGMSPLMNSHSQTIWQTQTPPELQGRVFSVRYLIAQCTVPLGTVLAGVFGGLFNPGLLMGILGIVLALFCLAQLFNPYLLQVEDKAYLDNLAAERARSRN
jgi:MFS transporter, DHA3 family, macrolide efflux protein